MQIKDKEVKAKEIVATKGQINATYRLIGHDLYLQGVPSQQYYQMLGKMKQKKALKGSRTERGWIKITFIDEIPEEGLFGEFFEQMLKSLQMMGFICAVREI